MPIYRYDAVNGQGKKTNGLLNAYNRRAAMERLEELGLAEVSLKDKTDSLELKLTTFFNPVKTKDLVIFSRQFSVMISANLPLVQSLRIASEQTDNIALKMNISELAFEVDGGSSLSAAMMKRPKIFTAFYTNVVKSGETSGRLDEVLNYLADEMEKDYDMTAKIKGAMIYPAFVLSGLVAVGVLMMVVVVPQLTGILKETGSVLPLSTRIVIGISNFMIAFWWLLIIIIIAAIAAVRIFLNTPLGKHTWDLILLRLPVFGNLFQLIYMVRFTRSMNTLIVGGVTISKSLEVVAAVVGNYVYRDLIEKSRQSVEEGGSLARVFFDSDTVPKMVPQMITVGEKTGKLDLVFRKITDFYSREIQNILANLVSLLEPSIMVVMGVAVGVMVAAIILPMYNLAGQF
ncbi:MAG TPA: type II secretion system F family protein [Candidatus Nanoarchaeia archaeon]|nr:type II secretion system F family protein [Candidatus Nanoarchaeia archaeon]